MGGTFFGVWRFIFDISFSDLFLGERVNAYSQDFDLYGIVVRHHTGTGFLEITLDP